MSQTLNGALIQYSEEQDSAMQLAPDLDANDSASESDNDCHTQGRDHGDPEENIIEINEAEGAKNFKIAIENAISAKLLVDAIAKLPTSNQVTGIFYRLS